ncbi:hypothetical protein [Massilia frigida]|uniref:hypothetical protein n=1 Tax=Massilia frigida TaxID=2609281 RepID=UPI001422235C|nr:hypothetical protein [Massilia frigida]
MGMIERCSYCRVVRGIAFWGAFPEAKWKRPALLIVSLVIGGGTVILNWVLFEKAAYISFFLLSLPLGALGFMGVLVALKGCDACVARLFGSP